MSTTIEETLSTVIDALENDLSSLIDAQQDKLLHISSLEDSLFINTEPQVQHQSLIPIFKKTQSQSYIPVMKNSMAGPKFIPLKYLKTQDPIAVYLQDIIRFASSNPIVPKKSYNFELSRSPIAHKRFDEFLIGLFPVSFYQEQLQKFKNGFTTMIPNHKKIVSFSGDIQYFNFEDHDFTSSNSDAESDKMKVSKIFLANSIVESSRHYFEFKFPRQVEELRFDTAVFQSKGLVTRESESSSTFRYWIFFTLLTFIYLGLEEIHD